jgi:hypothetical protein
MKRGKEGCRGVYLFSSQRAGSLNNRIFSVNLASDWFGALSHSGQRRLKLLLGIFVESHAMVNLLHQESAVDVACKHLPLHLYI